MNYDNYKLETPPETPENECLYCGEKSEKTYCNSDCKKAYECDY